MELAGGDNVWRYIQKYTHDWKATQTEIYRQTKSQQQTLH